MSVRIPEYITMVEVHTSICNGQSVTLPVGAFVKPIDIYYLPKHIKDSPEFRWYSPDTDVVCYCYYGIVIIKKEQLRKI